jgi:hypothetical protein
MPRGNWRSMKRLRLGNMTSDVSGVSLVYAAVAKDARATRRGMEDQKTVFKACNEFRVSAMDGNSGHIHS